MWRLTLQPSRRLKAKVVHVAVALFLLLNSNLLKAQSGIRNVSAATNVIVHWTRCWHATVQIRRFTVVLATASCSDQKASATVTHPPCRQTANRHSTMCLSWEVHDQLMVRAAHVVASLSMLLNKWLAKAIRGTRDVSTAPIVIVPSTRRIFVMHPTARFTGELALNICKIYRY